jgi:hypothetical protein
MEGWSLWRSGCGTSYAAQSGDRRYTIIYYEKRRLDEGEGKKGRRNYWLKRVLYVESFGILDSSNIFQFNVSQETNNCRSGAWNLITLKDFLNTFYVEPELDTQ